MQYTGRYTAVKHSRQTGSAMAGHINQANVILLGRVDDFFLNRAFTDFYLGLNPLPLKISFFSGQVILNF